MEKEIELNILKMMNKLDDCSEEAVDIARVFLESISRKQMGSAMLAISYVLETLFSNTKSNAQKEFFCVFFQKQIDFFKTNPDFAKEKSAEKH